MLASDGAPSGASRAAVDVAFTANGTKSACQERSAIRSLWPIANMSPRYEGRASLEDDMIKHTIANDRLPSPGVDTEPGRHTPWRPRSQTLQWAAQGFLQPHCQPSTREPAGHQIPKVPLRSQGPFWKMSASGSWRTPAKPGARPISATSRSHLMRVGVAGSMPALLGSPPSRFFPKLRARNAAPRMAT